MLVKANSSVQTRPGSEPRADAKTAEAKTEAHGAAAVQARTATVTADAYEASKGAQTVALAPRAEDMQEVRRQRGEKRPVLSSRRRGHAEETKKLQSQLRDLGYTIDDSEGTFGRSTEEAVKAFQRPQGLTDDGVVQSTTWAALDAALAVDASGGAASGPPTAARARSELAELKESRQHARNHEGSRKLHGRLRDTIAELPPEEARAFVESLSDEQLQELAKIDDDTVRDSGEPTVSRTLAGRLANASDAQRIIDNYHEASRSFKDDDKARAAEEVVDIGRAFLKNAAPDQKLALIRSLRSSLGKPGSKATISEPGAIKPSELKEPQYEPKAVIIAEAIGSLKGNDGAVREAVSLLSDQQLDIVTRSALQETRTRRYGMPSYHGGVSHLESDSLDEDPAPLRRMIETVEAADISRARGETLEEKGAFRARVFVSSVKAIEDGVVKRRGLPKWAVGLNPEIRGVRDSLIGLLENNTAATFAALQDRDVTGRALSTLVTYSWGPEEYERLHAGEDALTGPGGPFHKVVENLRRGDDQSHHPADWFMRGNRTEQEKVYRNGEVPVDGYNARRNLGYFVGAVQGGMLMFGRTLRDDTQRIINRDNTMYRILRDYVPGGESLLKGKAAELFQTLGKTIFGWVQGASAAHKMKAAHDTLGKMSPNIFRLDNWQSEDRQGAALPSKESIRERYPVSNRMIAQLREEYKAGFRSGITYGQQFMAEGWPVDPWGSRFQIPR